MASLPLEATLSKVLLAGHLLDTKLAICCQVSWGVLLHPQAVPEQGQALFCFQSASLHWGQTDCVLAPLMLEIGQGCVHGTGNVIMDNNACTTGCC